MKYCQSCSSQLGDDALFCGNCGAPQPPIAQSVPNQSAPQTTQQQEFQQQPMQQGYPQQQVQQPMQQGFQQQPMQQAYPQQQVQQPMQQGFQQQPMQQGYPQHQVQQPMQQGYPQQQGFQQQPMQQGYPQQQGFQQQPMQQGYPQQQVQQPMQQDYPQQQGFQQQPMQQNYPQQQVQQPMQQGYPQQQVQQPMQQGYPQQQGFQQQPMQQGYPQKPGYVPHQKEEFELPTYPEGTPLLTIKWKEAYGYLEDKLAQSLVRVTIKVNGVQIAPDNVLSYKKGFAISVPTQNQMHIEVKIGNKLIKVAGTKNVYDLELDPSQSYIMELTDYSTIVNNVILGYKLMDTSNNIYYEYGNTKLSLEWLCILIPLIGIYFSFFTPEAKQNKIIRNVYLQATMTGFGIWAVIILFLVGVL